MSNQNNSYVPTDRNLNGRPSFPAMGPVTVNPHACGAGAVRAATSSGPAFVNHI